MLQSNIQIELSLAGEKRVTADIIHAFVPNECQQPQDRAQQHRNEDE